MAEKVLLEFDPANPTARIRGLNPADPPKSRIEGRLAKRNERTAKFPDEWDDASQEKFMSGSMTKDELEKFLPKFSFLQRDDGIIWKFDSISTVRNGLLAGVDQITIRNPDGVPLRKRLSEFVVDLTSSRKDDMRAKLDKPRALASRSFSLIGLYEPLK
jgi:hypothetical protein